MLPYFLLIHLPQTLLSNPVLDQAVNMEAVQMISCSPHTYNQVVRDCVAASQRVEGVVYYLLKLLKYIELLNYTSVCRLWQAH